MNANPNLRSPRAAFTLIELMIVIGIIAVLAAMIFPAFSSIKKRNQLAKARAELVQLELAIAAYKTKYGFFPPSNGLGRYQPAAQREFFALNPLYFELKGTKLTGANYVTLDNRVTLPSAAVQVQAAFGGAGGVSGFVNCTRGSADESSPARSFLVESRTGQYALGTYGGQTIALLTCSVPWSRDLPPVIDGFTPAVDGTYPNPWRYNSLTPTNNPGGFDLWVDIIQGGRTNRVSNWSARPQIVYDP
jgi:prepilin-type N-terminal cleavage/methylation domain-containing protein